VLEQLGIERCTVHFTSDIARRDQCNVVAAALREVFNAAGPKQAKERVTGVRERRGTAAPKVCELLVGAEEEDPGRRGTPTLALRRGGWEGALRFAVGHGETYSRRPVWRCKSPMLSCTS
jgi:hypothetical protein